ncbi:transglycosylase domain-containing protein [Patulibacter americanus]|uniref:transglycosylase domain-containing protein n=1 Tax=Patulibacter americanus TaxID=588672 RepID=UPI0003B30A09|nr:transglycosylase domain-containing protein [Patulibacter americanus]
MSHAARKRRQRRSKGGATRIVLVLLVLLVLGIGGSAAAGVGYVVSVADSVDLDELDRVDPGAPSVVYAKDGTRLGYLPGPVLREKVKTTQMTDLVRNATVAVEDRRFYDHAGVDVEGVFRAATRNLTAGSNVEGASTLEMQLIRNLYTEDRTGSIERKIREAALAQQLEDRHPGRDGKTWVLTTYLNTAPYGTVGGQDIKGVQAAARVYFRTTAKKLTLPQAAMIAGLPQAPTQYNPYNNPEAALARRNDVIRRMAEQGYVTPEEAAEAQETKLGVKDGGTYYTTRRERFFLNHVRNVLKDKYGRKRVAQGGLKVYTTIDLKKQKLARKAMGDNLNPSAGDPSSAIVTLDPATGNIEAAASSQPFGSNQYDLALQGSRQPGSTYKTIVLTTALEQGISPSTSYPAPGRFTIPPPFCTGTDCSIKNFAGEGSKGGSMDLRTATLKSVNTVFMQLGLDVGMENVSKTARAMGITSKLNSYPSESLGSASVSPLEIARVYATISNGGMRVTPRAITKVVFADGDVKRPQPVRRTRAIPKDVASEVNRILQADMKGGTAAAADIGCPAGAKTGTTDGPTDVWLAGYTPKLSTAVWVGFPTGSKTIYSTTTAGGNIQGASVSAPIWKQYMQGAHGDFCGDFKGLVPFSGTKGTGKFASGAGTKSSDPSDTSGESSPGDATDGTTGGATNGASAGGTTTTASTGGAEPYPADSYESAPAAPAE